MHAVWISAALVVLWATWAGYINTAQFGDNIEQFNWAQSLELGYLKHPPLPSWLLGAVIKLFGPSIYWAYALAALCLVGTLGFTWSIARELVGERVAAAAIVLWGLNLTFSQRAQLYNHNTALVLFIAAAVWLSMRATQRESRMRWLWWLATGAAGGAAMLSKYQALVPLAGLTLALVGSGRVRKPADWAGLLLAIVAMTLIFTPHARWVVSHDFSTLRYASDAIESSNLPQRLGFIVSFLANQVRISFPALLAVGLCWAWSRHAARGVKAVTPSDAGASPAFGIWMTGLLWAGLGVLALMALGAGVSLRNHWGVQSLQFFSIWLAYRWDRRAPIDLRRLVIVALTVHAASLAMYAAEHRDETELLSTRRIDTMYPARRLAQAAVAHWTETTACPLRFVAGTVFDAGLVSLYSGGTVEVFDTAKATPWITPEALQRAGALYVLSETDPVPAGVTNVIRFDLVKGDRHGRPGKTIQLGVLPPVHSCSSD